LEGGLFSHTRDFATVKFDKRYSRNCSDNSHFAINDPLVVNSLRLGKAWRDRSSKSHHLCQRNRDRYREWSLRRTDIT